MILNIFKAGSAILNYHRIIPDKNFLSQNDELAVSVSKFEEQLTFLKKNYNLVSLENLLSFKKNSNKDISITFDDGYKDNLLHALPILVKLNVPATIYITTKIFNNEFDLWWYELHEYIWKNSDKIQFEFREKKFNFSVKNDLEKSKCFNILREIIKKLDKENQNQILHKVIGTSLRKQYKNELLSKDDLKILNNTPLVTIGAHTHNHLSLKNLKKEDCISEIKKSKKILEDLINKEINHFSYPYGTKKDVGKREFQIAQELGFKSAVTTCVGKLSKNKIFNLPRIHINQRANKNILKLKLSIFYLIYKKLQSVIALK